ncbi:probable ubiquitin-conjugating enzyme E2 26 [Cynara cardunculus var. scolymus]|uniref:probable ubiquitin-conjugating enzyme E2 26 n=1 Tax=Cynara cardunculus var. scolymus TaxID=59895 RepID=UPI000D627BEB|nr:probable ubiquitin-conjugating enzyme E2 26 [Cynara cardunculus var. scolymus]
MESSAITRYIPQKSKKRVFPGSSSACMEPEVIEIAPPTHNRTSKSKAKAIESKEIVYHEIIDVDMDEDRNDVVFVEGKVESNKKMKAISLGSSSATQSDATDMVHSMKKAKSNKGKDVVAIMSLNASSVSQLNSVDQGHSSKGFALGSDNFFDLDGVGSDVYADDYVFEDDYLTLQSHFDNMDLPSGIEVPIPWLPDTVKMNKMAFANPLVTSHTPFDQFGSSARLSRSKKKNSAGRSGFSKNVPPIEIPHKIQHLNFPNYTYDQLGDMNAASTGSYFSNISNPIVGSTTSSSFSLLPPLGVETPISEWHKSMMKTHMELNDALSGGVILPESTDSIYHMENMLVGPDAVNSPRSSSLVGSSSSMAKRDNEDVLKRYESFKKFDTVLDHSDHFFSKQRSAVKQPPKNWAKKIQDEWRILEKDLPDTIFVRVYESRMDLLRAVIIGAEGTPYHDGLFFFDIFFPSSYPSVPPLVHYHSGGLRINPNLYNCGKVCLSLINTWTGGPKERWIPGTSTMLQVLVSIQGLILNTNPYFNEPGFANTNGSAYGEKRSIDYNEKTLILSLKTMVYTMKKPPKNFEDLVIGHFRNRVRDILMACKAYTEGVQVGCLVKGGVQDVDEGGKSCSTEFKNNVASYVKVLISAFKEIGAKESQEFIGLSEKISRPAPVPAASAPTLPAVHPPAYSTFPFAPISAAAYNHYW